MAESALPFGTWPSPISARSLVAGVVGVREIVVDGDDVWFAESRPEQAGRSALMRWRAGTIDEMTPPGADVRTRVHEYGGGAWWVAGGTVWYSDDADQRLRRLDADGATTVLTPEPEIARGVRYADGRATPDKAWYVCVRETHSADSHEPVNDLVAVAGDGSGRIEVVASGADFYSSPRLSADGSEVVWIQWHHPNMPWDSTELWWAECVDGVVSGARRVAAAGDVSVLLPAFVDDQVWAVDDRDEWWNLRRFDPATGQSEPVVEGSFEIATPAWAFGLSRWVETESGPIVAATDPGGDVLIDIASGEVRDDWSAVGSLAPLGRGDDAGVVFVGACHDRPPAIVHWVPGREPVNLREPQRLGIDPSFFPDPDHIVFPTTDGEEAHAWFYAPAHPDHVGPGDELPPVVVMAHGGPTGRARTELILATRFWTSRGFAVVDVDYRGSTGYGRTYRRALDGRWGIADVDDCVAAVHWLIDQGHVDGDRVIIRGGSAGGLTVLGALASTDLFAAGGSHFGVADLAALVEETHKFEARYCDRLVAPWPEQRQVYDARSPIHRVDQISTPMIVLQGGEDRIVPPSQSEAVVAALAAQRIAHSYVYFPDEGHGFRDADAIVTAIESELAFYCHVLGLEAADELPSIEVRTG